ncbi:hypothetical protein GCM10022408_11420 [Hymenobacter fastidiosus]|uniref:Uncharacterized protein n=1 Tax=Hymenobacter fastidiosus TaxID=486264 RepID=A0ABP7RT30_9BACT
MKFPAHLDAATRKRIRAEVRGIGQPIQLVRDHPKPPKVPVQPKPQRTNGPKPVAPPPTPAQNQ